MDMEFTNFLNKMGNETSGRSRLTDEKLSRRPEPIEEYSEPKQKRRPEPEYVEPRQKRRPEPVEEYSEPVEEPKTIINEEFLDKAYDYAQGVIKVIRNNFKTAEEKVVMLESLQKAINYYLNNMGVQTPVIAAPKARQDVITEQEWNRMPVTSYEASTGNLRMNDLTGQEVKINPTTSAYNPSLNLGIKITPDGKQEVDLSKVTANDINEMKMLAGMIGPEAEAKRNEQAMLKNTKAQPQQFSQEALDEIAKVGRGA